MNTKHFFWSFAAVLGLAVTTFFLPTASINGQPTLQPPQLSPPPTTGPIPAGMEDQQGQQGAQDGKMEVMARGPVHEAFAEPVEAVVRNTLVSPKQPPEPIEEIPPDVKPEGDNVVWIPGYWIWDDERTDFIWVSGVWRAVPAGRKWIPGYWGQNENGFVRTPGFWAEERVNQVQYLPQPPESLEQGPTSDSPGIDYYWVPGCYEWRTRYAWRPGYWARANPNWIWCPAHYVFTPYGYVFVAGYWDYPVALRGVLFAPIYFYEPVYLRPRWYYSPWVSIDVGVLNVSFFSRPSYCHYYFGDYYDNRFVSAGFYPFFAVQTYHHGWYDPIYNYRRCLYSKSDPNWTHKLETQHEFFVKNVDQRPPKTFKEQAILAQKLKDTGKGERDNNVVFARNYKDFAANDKSMKFQTLQPAAREKFTEQANNFRKFSQERGELETKGGGKFATDKGLDAQGGPGDNKDGVKTLDFKGKGVVGNFGNQGSGGAGKFDGTPGTGRSRSDRGLGGDGGTGTGDNNKLGNQGLGNVNKGGDNKGLGDGNNPAFRKGGVGQDNIGGTGGNGPGSNFNKDKDKVSDGLKLSDGPKVGDGQKTGDGSKVGDGQKTFSGGNFPQGGNNQQGGGPQFKAGGDGSGQPTFKRGGTPSGSGNPNPGGSGNSNPGGSNNPGSGGRNSGGNKDGNKGKDDDNKGKMTLRDLDGAGGAGAGTGAGQKIGDGNPTPRTFSNPSLGGNQSNSGGSGAPKLSNDDLNKIRSRSFSGNNQDNGPSMRTYNKPPDNPNDGPKFSGGGGGGPSNLGGQKFMKGPDNSGGGGSGPPAQFRSGGGNPGGPKKMNVPQPNPDQGKDSDKDDKDKKKRR